VLDFAEVGRCFLYFLHFYWKKWSVEPNKLSKLIQITAAKHSRVNKGSVESACHSIIAIVSAEMSILKWKRVKEKN